MRDSTARATRTRLLVEAPDSGGSGCDDLSPWEVNEGIECDDAAKFPVPKRQRSEIASGELDLRIQASIGPGLPGIVDKGEPHYWACRSRRQLLTFDFVLVELIIRVVQVIVNRTAYLVRIAIEFGG